MILFLLVILWLVFGVMTGAALFYRQQRSNQRLGITLSPAHSQHPQVKATLASFTRACCLLLLLSVGCSLLLLSPALQSYGEFYMLLLVVANLFGNWAVIHRYQKKLVRIKEENNWIYPRKTIVRVDLKTSSEKGKASVSPTWVWLCFLLSFLPTGMVLWDPALGQSFPAVVTLVGPLCQLASVFLYYQARNLPSRLLVRDPEIHRTFSRQQERIGSIAAVLTALSMLVFWFVFQGSILLSGHYLLVLGSVVALVLVLLRVAYWQQSRMRRLEEELLEPLDQETPIQEEQPVWKWGFYYNPSNPRLFVPKRIASMGWTVNVGHPAGKPILFGTLAVVLAIVGLVTFGNIKEYDISLGETEVIIDAAMYDLTFSKDAIVSVSLLEQLPQGSRTNGYGGFAKSFGHFSLQGYGPCMVYVYHEAPYIVVELNSEPGYVFVNEKTPEETQALYASLLGWLKAGS